MLQGLDYHGVAEDGSPRWTRVTLSVTITYLWKLTRLLATQSHLR
jgi:hypothetical protein